MANIDFEVKYADVDDWLALSIKQASPQATNCPPEQCDDSHGWTPIDLRGGKGSYEGEPGLYYYRYEVGNTAGNQVHIKLFQDGVLQLEPIITIGSKNKTVGCNLFRIWEQE